MSRKKYPQSILVRLTESEKKNVDDRAAQAELSVSRYLVFSGTNDQTALDPSKRDERDRQREQVIFELRKIGVNLNQIAYALNAARRSGHDDGEPSAAEVRAAADELKAVLEFVKTHYEHS